MEKLAMGRDYLLKDCRYQWVFLRIYKWCHKEKVNIVNATFSEPCWRAEQGYVLRFSRKWKLAEKFWFQVMMFLSISVASVIRLHGTWKSWDKIYMIRLQIFSSFEWCKANFILKTKIFFGSSNWRFKMQRGKTYLQFFDILFGKEFYTETKQKIRKTGSPTVDIVI